MRGTPVGFCCSSYSAELTGSPPGDTASQVPTHLAHRIYHWQMPQAHRPEQVEHLGDMGVGRNSEGCGVHVRGDVLQRRQHGDPQPVLPAQDVTLATQTRSRPCGMGPQPPHPAPPPGKPCSPRSCAGSAASGPGRGCRGTSGNPRPSRRRRGVAGWHSAIPTQTLSLHWMWPLAEPRLGDPPSMSESRAGSAGPGQALWSETSCSKATSRPTP